MMELEERFWMKTDWRGEGCWLWRAGFTTEGYGKFSVASSSALAHRVAYELEVGEIPPGLVLDHRCRNRSCINPAHLEPVTPRENTLRGEGVSALNARKPHCHKHGVEFTRRTRRTGGEYRECLPCKNEYKRNRRRGLK